MANLFKQEVENQNELELNQFSVVINSEAIQKGLLIKTLGQRQFILLVAILSHIDENGQAFPSQRTLSAVTGMSLPTVNKGIKKLLETKINDEYVLKRELLPSDVIGEYSLYTVNQNVMELKEAADVKNERQQAKKPQTAEEIIAHVKDKDRQKPLVPKDYIQFISALCKVHLNTTVVPNYKKDTALVKFKLMAFMGEEELIDVIEFAVSHYKEYWYSDNYPVPSVGMFSSWLLNDAIKKMKVRQRYEANKEAASNMTYDNSTFLNL